MGKHKTPEEIKKLIQQQNEEVKKLMGEASKACKPVATLDKAMAQAEKFKALTKAEKD